jgi:hypothetical protein
MAQTISLMPAGMPKIGTVDERYQSYNIEMLEVTGGKFWRPYGPELKAALRASPRRPLRHRAATPPPA